jgi:dihydrofolate reductase
MRSPARDCEAPFAGITTIVFSRTMQQPDHPEVTVRLRTKFGLGSRAANWERQRYKDIWLFGGSELFRSFLDFGQVDTVEVKIISVLLRSGVPVFHCFLLLLLLTLRTNSGCTATRVIAPLEWCWRMKCSS